MKSIYTKDNIIQYVKHNLWQLTKENIFSLYKDRPNLKSPIKSSSKDDLIDKIIKDNIDMWDIYQYYKHKAFGLYPTMLEKILNIDKRQRLKMQKQGFIKIAYTKEDKIYGKYINIPYYSMEALIELTEEDIEEWKSKKDKRATSKQMESLKKARETAKINRTCKQCKTDVGNKNKLYKGLCGYCIEKNELKEKSNDAKASFREIYKNKDKYVILDTETTGLDNDDEIIEIAIVDLYGNALLNTYVYTSKKISEEAYYIHGIDKNMITQSPSLISLNDTINNIIKDKIVLIFNADFDTRMLYQSGFKGKINNECLMNLYMEYACVTRWISLSNAMHYEDISIIQDHSAKGDCLCCLALIEKIALNSIKK